MNVYKINLYWISKKVKGDVEKRNFQSIILVFGRFPNLDVLKRPLYRREMARGNGYEFGQCLDITIRTI